MLSPPIFLAEFSPRRFFEKFRCRTLWNVRRRQKKDVFAYL